MCSEDHFDPITRAQRLRSDELDNELDDLMLSLRAALIAIDRERLPQPLDELAATLPRLFDRTVALLHTLEARLRESEVVSLELAAKVGALEEAAGLAD